VTSLHLGILLVCLAAAPDEPPRVAQLVAQLGSDDFDERERATQALAAVGKPALPALRRAAESHPDVEVRRRAAKLIQLIDPPAPPDPDAEDFARRLQEIHDVIAKNSLVRPSRRRLAELALRGLYRGQGEDLPDDLAARLKDEKASAEQLGAVLHDGYRQLAARCELDVNLAVNEAVSFALRDLDPHGRFGPAQFRCDIVRQFWSGIGVDLRLDPKTLEARVVTPLKDGPAYKAGLRAGDVITHVHNHKGPGPNNQGGATEPVPTAGERIDRVYAWLAGAEDSRVVLTVRREGADAPVLVGVVRGPAVRETVLGFRRKDDDSWDYFADPERKIGYARLTAFMRDTDKQLGAILTGLEKQGARGVVLDLRGCPGGLTNALGATAGLFLKRGSVYCTIAAESRDYEESVPGGAARYNLPVVCLVNDETASVAEVMAAALQDHRRAAVVGERTRGRASFQTVQTADPDEITLTYAVFLRPSGMKLDRIALPGHGDGEWGVTPDAGNVVRLAPAEKDALKEHLERHPVIARRDVPPKEPAFKDRQLERALEVLARDGKTK
jgi:carboxyl-terminal processing protease